jgi:hypothetical protein
MKSRKKGIVTHKKTKQKTKDERDGRKSKEKRKQQQINRKARRNKYVEISRDRQIDAIYEERKRAIRKRKEGKTSQ